MTQFRQCNNVAPVTEFMGRPATSPIPTFLQTPGYPPSSIEKLKLERSMNQQQLSENIDNLNPVVQHSLITECECIRSQRSGVKLANFAEVDFLIASREQFNEGQNLSLRWCGTRRIKKVINDFVFLVEYWRNGEIQDIHGTRIKF